MLLEFLSFANDVLYDALPYALVCLSFVLTAKYIRFPDLTCSGSFVLGGAISAVCVVKLGLGSVAATLLATIAGGMAGVLTGFFYTVLRLDRLLAGILSAFVLYSVNLLLLTPTLPYGDHETLLSWFEGRDRNLLDGNVSWHPWTITIIALIVVLTKLLLDCFLASETGLTLRTLEDEIASDYVLRRQGLSPDRLKVLALVLGNATVALAGSLVSYKEGAANADRGFDLLITALVAFLVGTQSFAILRRLTQTLRLTELRLFDNITSAAVCGSLVYFALITISQRTSIPSSYTKILLVVLVVASISQSSVITTLFVSRRQGDERPDSGDTLLAIQNLTFRYPSADADSLHNFSLIVPPQSVVRLSGVNGSGKTTALQVIAGFLDANQGGRIFYKGTDLTQCPSARLGNFAYVDQDAQRGVVSTLSIEENLTLAGIGRTPSVWRKALRAQTKKRIEEALRVGDLPKDILPRLAGHLSGGQRQVVNLLSLVARAETPGVVLMDEPTNNLDMKNVRRCHQIISKLHDAGASIVIVSHSPLDGLPIDSEVVIEPVGDDSLQIREKVS